MGHLGLPLRIGVGIIVLNQNNEVFVAKRKDNPVDKWQMPQGGVEKNELFLDAMRRELYEETSIKEIKILREIDKWFQYDLPEHLLGKIWKGKFKGQKQKWFIVKFLGKDKDINLQTMNPEFIEWKWIKKEKLPSVVVDFKKHIYRELLTILQIFID